MLSLAAISKVILSLYPVELKNQKKRKENYFILRKRLSNFLIILALETGSLERKREIRFSINYFFKFIILPTFILLMVVKVGFEPTHPCGYLGLSQARLPIPPFDHICI